MGSSSDPETSRTPWAQRVRFGLFALAVVAIVVLPFVLFGESQALPLLENPAARRWVVVLIGVALLTVDSIAPIPSVLVIMAMAAKAGWLAGTIGGWVGLTGQVAGAAWFGRAAIGRLAPRFFPEAELTRLRCALPQRLYLTLACARSVPVLAETSVIIAGSIGVPLARIFRATLLPNLAIAAIYSLAAENSLITAAWVFVATAAPSYLLWRWTGSNNGAGK